MSQLKENEKSKYHILCEILFEFWVAVFECFCVVTFHVEQNIYRILQ